MILSIVVFAGIIVAGAIAVGTPPDPMTEVREQQFRKHYLDIYY